MTDAYRTAGFACPSCPNAPLREFQNRLVCDTCSGMLIRDDDFAAAIHELDGSSDPLTFHDRNEPGKPCPRCAGPMVLSDVSVGTIALKSPLLRCEPHGLWVLQSELTALFARVSRRRRMIGGHSSGPGVYGPPTSGGIVAAMQSIHDAFGGSAPATSGLTISQWSNTRPRVHTLFVSTYKDRRLGCPSCKEVALDYRGDRWACDTCSGSFVENAALTAMVMDMTNSPWELPVGVSDKAGERACPVCSEAMRVEVLEAVTIDRCAAHGVWFDDKELEAALHHVGTGSPTSIGGWLKQLFHRHGKIEDGGS
ncbi:MAG: hypothetical protein JWO36_4730 [Myxococcales bacterium]|nr:hypothetical protein [Myxococcales bacterium]